jgi:hypothetical protein
LSDLAKGVDESNDVVQGGRVVADFEGARRDFRVDRDEERQDIRVLIL